MLDQVPSAARNCTQPSRRNQKWAATVKDLHSSIGMDSHKGSLLLSGHHGSALPLSRALSASNSVLYPYCFLKRTEFFHTRKRDEKLITIITVSDDWRIGVQLPGEAEQLSVLRRTIPAVGPTKFPTQWMSGALLFPHSKGPVGGEVTTLFHPLSSLRMCGRVPPLPSIRYYMAVSSAQTTSHLVA
jgi:hypothetical protein